MAINRHHVFVAVCFRISKCSCSVAQQRGASGEMRPGAQGLEAHQHTLFRHLKNKFFRRNLGQNMPKNAYFLEKKAVKLPQRRGLRSRSSGGWGLRLQTPTLLLPFTDIV